jgi:hypothetical protein
MEELRRYFQIANQLRGRRKVPSQDMLFFLSYTHQIDEAKMRKLVEGGEFATTEDVRAALMEAGKALQTSPEYKQLLLEVAQSADAERTTSKVAQTANLILGGVDIATSINQIRQGDKAARESRRPARPAIPQRDIFLQQALRGAEENIYDTERAIAPVRQEIQDNYLNDLQAAKTASTGQAGAYGAYRQLASMNRNRAAAELAPIQDQIRRGQQARYDNLLGMRMGETQQMFENQASLYPYDLQQYNYDQKAAASLGSTGRANLRDSLYNLSGQVAGVVGQNAAQRRYSNLINRAIASGLPPDIVVGAEENINRYNPHLNEQSYYEQLYGAQ